MAHILTERIKQWATERDLHNADSAKQILKLGEEYGELCEYMTKDQEVEKAIDAIGDIYVVLTILTLQLDLDIEECIEYAYKEIKNRKGKLVNGAFVKEGDL